MEATHARIRLLETENRELKKRVSTGRGDAGSAQQLMDLQGEVASLLTWKK